MKVTFHSDVEMAYFMQFIPLIRSTLPPYIYLIIKFNLLLSTEEYSNLNGELVRIFTGVSLPGIPPIPQYWYLNADASDEDGYIEPEAISGGYTNINDRLFELSRALKTQPYEFVTTQEAINEDAQTDGRLLTVQEGTLLQNIPANATTAQVSKLLFLDFS